MSKTFLFVGGSHDGTWMTLPDEDRPYISMVKRLKPRQHGFVRDNSTEEIYMEKEEYKQMRFRGELEQFAIMALHGLTADDVFKMMLLNYRPTVAA